MADTVEVVCPACGEVNAFPADQAARPQSCAQCEALLGVPGEDAEAPESDGTIVLICPFCDERAVFDGSAAGSAAPCPHCGEEIDVLGSRVEPEDAGHDIFFRCDWCNEIVQAGSDALESGCECPRCREVNEPDDVRGNRLTTGQAERLGLIRPPEESA